MQQTNEIRPWGSYTILDESAVHKTKRIEVNPNQRLSYQSHQKRDELWMIIEGEAVVTLNDKEIMLNYGQKVEIKAGEKHRVENRSDKIMKFIEIQTGTYFGEDDIIRYQDDYSRT
jgi:mannose-6-phosphate isomerase